MLILLISYDPVIVLIFSIIGLPPVALLFEKCRRGWLRAPGFETTSESKAQKRSQPVTLAERSVSLIGFIFAVTPIAVPLSIYCAFPAFLVPFLNQPQARFLLFSLLTWYLFGLALKTASRPSKAWFLIFGLPMILVFAFGPMLNFQTGLSSIENKARLTMPWAQLYQDNNEEAAKNAAAKNETNSKTPEKAK